MSMKNRRKTMLAVLAALTAGITSGSAMAQEKVVLRTDFPPVPIHSALFLAQSKGWFKEAGIDIEIQDGRGSANTIQLVGARQVDIGYVSLGPIMPAREAGMKIKSFAAVSHKGDLGVIFDPKQGIKTVLDLKGKTLLCFAGSTWTPFIPMFLKAAGLDPSTVTVLNIDVNAMWTSYMANQGDAVLSIPPFGLAQVQDVRPSQAFLAADHGVPLLGYGLVAHEETIASRTAVLAKVAQIVARSWAYIYDGHEEEAVAAISKMRPEVKVDAVVARRVLALYKDYFFTAESTGKPLWKQYESEWQAALKTQTDAGVIKPNHTTGEFYTEAVTKTLE